MVWVLEKHIAPVLAAYTCCVYSRLRPTYRANPQALLIDFCVRVCRCAGECVRVCRWVQVCAYRCVQVSVCRLLCRWVCAGYCAGECVQVCGCVCACVQVCAYRCVQVSVCVNACVSVCRWVRTGVCRWVRVWVCAGECVQVCAGECVWVHACVCRWVCAVCVQVSVCRCLCAGVCVQVSVCRCVKCAGVWDRCEDIYLQQVWTTHHSLQQNAGIHETALITWKTEVAAGVTQEMSEHRKPLPCCHPFKVTIYQCTHLSCGCQFGDQFN